MIYHEHIAKDNLLLTIFYGDVSSADLNLFIDKVVQYDFDNQPMRGLNILCKNLSFKNLNTRVIFQVGKKMQRAKFNQHGKNAIIAKSNLAYAFSRAYQMATELKKVDETKVYRIEGLADALLWLELSYKIVDIQAKVAYCEQHENRTFNS